MTTRAFVTGAAGFLAGHLAAALRRGGADVTGADTRAIPAGRCDAAVYADAHDGLALQAVLRSAGPDEVYHLVGDARGTDEEVRRSNIDTARILLDAVRVASPSARIVLVGSAAEYGTVAAAAQPVDESFHGSPAFAYGRAKQAVSALATAVARNGQHVVVARPFNVIGAGVPETLVVGALVRRLRDALASPPPRRVVVGVTTAVRDFVDATDIAEGMIVLARHGARGAAYNLCTGRGHAIAEVVTRLCALAGDAIDVVEDPSLSRPGEVSMMVGSPAKAEALGWRAVRSLDDSLRAAWHATAPAGAAA